MALPAPSSSSSLSLPRRDGSRRESVSPFAGRRESINPFAANKRDGASPFAARRESVAPFQNLNRRESTIGSSRRESTSPFPSLRRSSTIPSGAYSNIPVGRKFSVSAIYTGGDVSPIEPPGGANNDDVEVLFHHPTRIVSFTISEEKLKGKDAVANYIQPTERTLSSGPMKIYRVKFSTAFLQGGQLLQPLLPRSACWCLDERRGIFVLRIRKDNYYRLELQEVEGDLSKVQSLKSVLDKLIVFEKTNCPFRSEKQDVEEPAPLAVFRRSSSVASRPSRPSSAQSDYGAPDNDSCSGSDIVFREPGFNAPPKVEVSPSLPVMFKKNIFEDKPMLRVPRLQVPQQHNLSASPRALSPLSGKSPLARAYEASRTRSISPFAREAQNDMFMIPEHSPEFPHTDDEGASSVQSVGSGPPSPRYIPRSIPSTYANSAAPSEYTYAMSAAPSASDYGDGDSMTSSPIDPFSLSYPVPEHRGRSPERKPMLPPLPASTISPPPTAISPPPTAPMHFLRPPSVVIQNADATDDDFEIDLLDLDIRQSPQVHAHEEVREKPKPLPLELHEAEPRSESIVQLRNEDQENANEVPSIFEPLQNISEISLPQIRPQTPLPSPPATPPLSHSASDSEAEEIMEAVTPECSFRRKASGDISNVSLRRGSESRVDTTSVIIKDNDPDAMTMTTTYDTEYDPLAGLNMSLAHRANDITTDEVEYDPLAGLNMSIARRSSNVSKGEAEYDPLAGLNMSLIPRASDMPVTKVPGPEDYEPLSRTGRRFIRSMDYEAARGVFGRTVNLKIHQPTGFLLNFMLRVADKLMKGAKIYAYYWGDWKKGKVKGKGGRVKKRGSMDDSFSPISPEEYEKYGLLSDEDDYGADGYLSNQVDHFTRCYNYKDMKR
ncbi:hypothetical protein TWF481_004039 [Arthrobotrys musiformis]|uniref:Inheritance of peroxisomes protein 1 n=1 Tax=Arthrobotrys musiformis TaxID=47236 RepID=A0AAV9WJ97_9PEZI